MPRTKAHPIEVKKKTVRTKLIFIALIAALVGVTNVVMAQKSAEEKAQAKQKVEKPAEKPHLLGSSTEKEAQLGADLTRRFQTTSEDVLGATEEFVDQTKEKVETSVNDLIYTSTIKPLVDKIQSLPNDQKEQIKEAVCK